jgi:hypothetical protein
MTSADFIYRNYNGTIYTDTYHSLYFVDIYHSKDINTYNASFFRNDTKALTGISVIRNYALKNYFIVEPSSKKQIGYTGSTVTEGNKFNLHIFDDVNKIYDCESVSMYKK